MSRNFRSLALLIAITLVSLVASATARDNQGRPSDNQGRPARQPDNQGRPSDNQSRPARQQVSQGRPSDNQVRPARQPEVRQRGGDTPEKNRGPQQGFAYQRNNQVVSRQIERRPKIEKAPADRDRNVDRAAPAVNATAAKAARLGFRGEIAAGGGFKVTGIEPRGAADAAGLQVGDLVVSANGIAINTLNDATRAIQAANGVLILDVVDVITRAAARRSLRF